MKIQWTGENFDDVKRLLDHHACQVRDDSGVLRITGIGDLDTRVELGETIEVRLRGGGLFDGIGIHRTPYEGPEPEIIWDGTNAGAIAAFVEKHDVDVSVIGDDLFLGHQNEKTLVHRGDKLLIRDGRYLCCSRAGKDHRV